MQLQELFIVSKANHEDSLVSPELVALHHEADGSQLWPAPHRKRTLPALGETVNERLDNKLEDGYHDLSKYRL